MSIIRKYLLTVTVLFITFPASAMTVRVEVTGSVIFVDGTISGEFPLGTPMSGFFEYNPPGTDLDLTFTQFGVYNDALTAFSMTIGTYTATAPGGEMRVRDFSSDELQVNPTPASGLTGGPVNGLSLIRGHYFLNDPAANTLSTDALPTPAEIMAFPDGFANLVFDNGFVGGQVSAGYTTVVAFIPEPSSCLLFLGGGLFFLRPMTRKAMTLPEVTESQSWSAAFW